MPPKRARKETAIEKEESGVPIKKTRGRKKTEEVVKEEKVKEKAESNIKEKKVKEKVVKTKSTRAKKEPKEKEPKSTSTTLQNKASTDWQSINFSCQKKNSQGKVPNLKITSWNVDGLRAWLKKDGLSILEHDKPDIFCLQETKCSEDKLPTEVTDIEGYKTYWCASEKDGYAGVALFTKIEPKEVKYGIGKEEHDDEGRCIMAEYDKFYLVNVYVPNAGRGLVTLPKRLKWNETFKSYIASLDKKKPVIITGDMNVAHNEIDIANPKTNTKNAGFTKEEREGMTDFLKSGYVDTFRHLYPDEKDVYTFWSYITKARLKNIGWRLDYFLVSERLMDNVCDNVVLNEVYGSDHCPITLYINI